MPLAKHGELELGGVSDDMWPQRLHLMIGDVLCTKATSAIYIYISRQVRTYEFHELKDLKRRA